MRFDNVANAVVELIADRSPFDIDIAQIRVDNCTPYASPSVDIDLRLTTDLISAMRFAENTEPKKAKKASSSGITELLLTPKKIIRNKRTTVVIWKDKTKTIVRCEKDRMYDEYEAFTAALAKKIFQNNTRLKKMIKDKFVCQEGDGDCAS